MGLNLDKTQDYIMVISYKDDAVKCKAELYEKYLKSLDEDILQLEGVPTRFKLQLLTDNKTEKIMRKQKALVRDAGIEMDWGKQAENIKYYLKDIENPAGELLRFRNDGGEYAHDDLVTLLISTGIAAELSAARTYALQNVNGPAIEERTKKSEPSST